MFWGLCITYYCVYRKGYLFLVYSNLCVCTCACVIISVDNMDVASLYFLMLKLEVGLRKGIGGHKSTSFLSNMVSMDRRLVYHHTVLCYWDVWKKKIVNLLLVVIVAVHCRLLSTFSS